MPRNKLNDVRDHLIAAMEELAEGGVEDKRMDELSKLNDIGKTLVESAKAEAQYVGQLSKLTKSADGTVVYESGFIPNNNQLKE